MEAHERDRATAVSSQCLPSRRWPGSASSRPQATLMDNCNDCRHYMHMRLPTHPRHFRNRDSKVFVSGDSGDGCRPASGGSSLEVACSAISRAARLKVVGAAEALAIHHNIKGDKSGPGGMLRIAVLACWTCVGGIATADAWGALCTCTGWVVDPSRRIDCVSKLGQGGFGAVLKAKGPGGIECALKIISHGER